MTILLALLALSTALGTVASVQHIRQGRWRRKSEHEIGLEQAEFLFGITCTLAFTAGAVWLAI